MCSAYRRMPPFMLFLLIPAGVAEWQTRRTQNPLPAGACGFDSLLLRSPPSKILEIGRNRHFIGFFAIRIVSNAVNHCQPMTRFRLYWQQLVTMGNCDFSRDFGAREWGRTITALRPPDFESGASARSATRAQQKNSIFARRRNFG